MFKQRKRVIRKTIWWWLWEKVSIIDVQCQQENPNPRVHRSSGKLGKRRFPLEWWTLGLGFSCPHWTLDQLSRAVERLPFHYVALTTRGRNRQFLVWLHWTPMMDSIYLLTYQLGDRSPTDLSRLSSNRCGYHFLCTALWCCNMSNTIHITCNIEDIFVITCYKNLYTCMYFKIC